METPPTPEPRRSGLPKPDHVFLSPEVIELHLRNGEPVDPQKAKLIHLLNKPVPGDPETARDGDW